MVDTEHAEAVDPKNIFARALEILVELESCKNGNGLLLTYDPDKEKFQFLAIHSDPEEVYALLLSGMAALRDIVKDTNTERTLN